MSDPVKNAEVEDVLSSIRRLVSEDKRPIQAPNSRSVADRLVLTPDHRVDQIKEPSAVVDIHKTAVAPEDHQPAMVVTDAPETARFVETTAEDPDVADVQEAPFVDVDENLGIYGQEDTVIEMSGELNMDASKVPFFETEEFHAGIIAEDKAAKVIPDDSPAAKEELEKAPAKARFAIADTFAAQEEGYSDTIEFTNLEGLESDYSADPYDFAGDDDIEDPDLTVLPSEFTTSRQKPWAAVDDVASASILPLAARAAAKNAQSASLTDKIEALETVVGNLSDDWEPDRAGEDDYAGSEMSAMAWEDDIEEIAEEPDTEKPEKGPRAAANPEADAEYAEFDEVDSSDNEHGNDTISAAKFGISSDDQMIDEEALRDLISDIVREELQGALGERITRNVRKLVRREIRRALTAQEME